MCAPKHVLFVCTGNTCRSPMAEGMLRMALGEREDFTVGSAGVAAMKGQPASPETVTILKRRGAHLDQFRSRRVTEALLKAATHVLAMTEGHLAALESRFPDYRDKYFLVCEFSGSAEQPCGYSMDIPDPIGMGLAAYEEVAELLDAAIPSIIAYIDKTYQP